MNRPKPHEGNFNLKYKNTSRAKNEFAYILMELQKQGYLWFSESEVFIRGGQRDPDFNINVVSINTDRIETTALTDEILKSKTVKLKDGTLKHTKSFGSKFMEEFINQFAGGLAKFVWYILLLLAGYVLGKLF